MINGTVNIKGFLILDRIREKHEVLDKDWAKASGLLYGARISELRAMAEGSRIVLDRAFTFKKFVVLARSLQTIIGGDVMRKALAELLEKAQDKDEQLILLVTTLSEECKDQAISFLKLLNKVPEKL